MLFIAAKNMLWALTLTVQVISYGSYTILVHLCEENGQIQFNSTSMNLLIELIKLQIALVAHGFSRYFKTHPRYSILSDVESNETGQFHRPRLKPIGQLKASLDFATPAFLYFINNNLAVYIQLYMDSTSYQMLSNLKIFTTAVLYYLVFGRRMLTKSKMASLVLLFIAGLVYSVANLKSISSYYIDESDLQSLFSNLEFSSLSPPRQGVKFRLRDQIYITEIGFLMMCVYCVLSGVSGVYNEYLLKRNLAESINLQNAYLYSYGCLFNLLAYFFEATYFNRPTLLSTEFFSGFSVFTWLIVASQVLNGFLMSIVMKHSSNITRLFVISCSLVVTTVLSVLVFSLKLNGFFYFCFSLIMLSLYLYVQ